LTAGANALFMEAHPDPAHAKSDASTVLNFDTLKKLLTQAEKLYRCLDDPSFSLTY